MDRTTKEKIQNKSIKVKNCLSKLQATFTFHFRLLISSFNHSPSAVIRLVPPTEGQFKKALLAQTYFDNTRFSTEPKSLLQRSLPQRHTTKKTKAPKRELPIYLAKQDLSNFSNNFYLYQHVLRQSLHCNA